MTKYFINSLLFYVSVYLLILFQIGCSYTRLAKSQSEPSLLPDLAIKNASAVVERTLWMDAGWDVAAKYRVVVVNIGRAPYNGDLTIGWNDDFNEFHAGIYKPGGTLKSCTLAPNDSIVLKGSWSYGDIERPDSIVTLALLTRTFMPAYGHGKYYKDGSYPVQEERYDNNELEIILHFDSTPTK